MRLISCYIENFGKWSDKSFTFNQGCNVICRENGWGKSTLAVFVRVMLYGFQDEKVRDEYRNERKRYRPWQGGVYGGRLEFEAGGQSYVISRVFGTREKEDRFSLREKDTNLVSNAYSASVGEELFQLDCNSFNRTVFISQNDCETSVTDGIHAKIGNLSQAADDISNYEKADRKLQEMLNQMTPDRKTGSLNRMKSEIGRLEESVRAGRAVSQAMEQVQERLHLKLQEQETLKGEQSELLRRQQEISAYREVQARQERYKGLCEEYARRKERLEQERAYFPGRIPEQEEIDAYLARSARLSAAQEAVRLGQMTEKERERNGFLAQMFREGVPDTQDLQEQAQRVRQIREMDLKIAQNSLSAQEKEQYGTFEAQFAKGIPETGTLDGIIADWRRSMDLKNVLGQKRLTMETLKEIGLKEQNSQKQIAQKAFGGKRSGGGILAVAGAICLILGLVFWLALEQPLPGGVFTAVGGGAVLGGILWLCLVRGSQRQDVVSWSQDRWQQEQDSLEENSGWKRMAQEIAEEEDFIEDVARRVEAFLAEYGWEGSREEEVLDLLYGLKADIREYLALREKVQKAKTGKLEETRRNLVGNVSDFLGQFYGENELEESRTMEADHLDRLLDEVKTYSREYALLEKKQEEFQRAGEVYRNMVSRLQEYVSSILLTPEQDLHAQLLTVRRHRQQIQACEQELDQAMRQKAAFEETENLEEILGAGSFVDPESLTDINSRLEELSRQLEAGYEIVAEYNRQLEHLREECDQAAEEEEDLAVVRESYEEERKRYDILKNTRAFLEQARTSFTSRYTEPVRKGFEKYYEMLSGESAAGYHMDANVNVTVEDKGMQREPRFLSTGYRDLVGICMRMALVDAMYREEKPFIIFDDPFANLDEDKMEGALGFLEAIGQEYQVLYFTCHGSRMGKADG